MQILKIICLTAGFFIYSLKSVAQKLPVPRNIALTYEKGTRSHDGAPGKNYWQNSADYTMKIHFAPSTRLVSGSVDIEYFNNSPDTLSQVVFKLYPNLYKKGTPRQRMIDPEDITDGVQIDSMWIDNQVSAASGRTINGTNMTVNRQMILPGSKTRFRIVYHYILNKKSHIRTGEIEPNAHFIAYFFPRITVYDDIDGWNRHPYNGNQEFYNDHCNFEAYISVPKNFIVWATGDLKNCSEVLMPAYCEKIRQAENQEAIINIIDSTDDRQTITADRPFNTWHYSARNVPDFAFATSDHYTWQSSSLVVDPKTSRRTRVDAVFNPKHHDYFWVAGDAHKTVEYMSYVFPKWPFPYPHITVFDGLDQME
ncbi:MAG: M1 family metallopeptidase, partial [Flavisolibacter sp.]